jgi:hypothetical protein
MKNTDDSRSESISFQSAPTQWTKIRLAGRQDLPEGRAALIELLPRMLRRSRRGIARLSPKDAQDFAQEFLAQPDVLRGFFFLRADPRKGKFRYYVESAARKTWLTAERQRRAEKRGGRLVHECIDAQNDDAGRQLGARELVDAGPSPEDSCETRFRLGIFEATVRELRQEYERDGKGPVFDILFESVTDSDDLEFARRLGRTLGTARTRRCRFNRELEERFEKNLTHTRCSGPRG